MKNKYRFFLNLCFIKMSHKCVSSKQQKCSDVLELTFLFFYDFIFILSNHKFTNFNDLAMKHLLFVAWWKNVKSKYCCCRIVNQHFCILNLFLNFTQWTNLGKEGPCRITQNIIHKYKKQKNHILQKIFLSYLGQIFFQCSRISKQGLLSGLWLYT